MDLQLKLIGITMIVLGMVHAVFPRYFDWRNALSSLNLINRQLMYVHTFFIALVVVMMGALCLSSANDLIETGLGNKISFGLFVFWFARLLIQFFGYSSTLWRGKRFETIVHVIFSILWTYFSVVFFSVYWFGNGK